MPLQNEELNVVYEDFVKPVLEGSCDLLCERGDDIFGSNIIMEDIEKSIKASDLIVADLTGKNPNVFYEVGISHTLRKPVLLLAQSIEDVPFDLRHRRVLLYEYSPRGCRKLERNVAENIKEMLKTIKQ
jgi:nucleoside 2-deoxyribosyltransferase